MILALLAIVGVVTNVHDGDTFRLGVTRARLAGIDANEMDGSCHHACAALSAPAARDYLAGLILGREVRCEQVGTSYNRVVAWCSVGGRDLSCEMVRAGGAVRWDRYDPDRRLVGCEGRR